jgi:hypothetical protein
MSSACDAVHPVYGRHAQTGTDMIKTVEAVIDEQGNVRLLEPVHPRTARARS